MLAAFGTGPTKDKNLLTEEQALKIAASFGAGIANTGGLCGAFAGALMVLGLRRASATPDRAEKDRIHDEASRMLEKLNAEMGGMDCNPLRGKPATGKHIKGGSKATCTRAIEAACRVIQETTGPDSA